MAGIPTGAVPLSRAGVPALAGRFAVVEVATANTVRGPMLRVSRSSLTLALADSAQRAEARVRGIGRARREDLQLVGRREYASEEWPSEPAEVESGVLWLGCRNCTDFVPTIFRIEGVSEEGFFGSWVDRDAGFAVLTDVETGETQRLGDTSGYFCAWRQD